MGTRALLQRFLIVCEGEKTEPAYFNSFRVPKEVIDVYGIGDNTVGLVREAIRLREKAARSAYPEDQYDQVWCVFDRDSFPAQHFNEALHLAADQDIQVAYSNEAFELWYLLHFNYYDTALSRADYCARLSQLLGHSYHKNSDTLYQELEARQATAIRHARRLLGQYTPPQPVSDNPSTTVHLLVEQLNRFVTW